MCAAGSYFLGGNMYRQANATGFVSICESTKIDHVTHPIIMEISTETMISANLERAIQILSLHDLKEVTFSIVVTPEVKKLLKEVIECTQ